METNELDYQHPGQPNTKSIEWRKNLHELLGMSIYAGGDAVLAKVRDLVEAQAKQQQEIAVLRALVAERNQHVVLREINSLWPDQITPLEEFLRKLQGKDG